MARQHGDDDGVPRVRLTKPAGSLGALEELSVRLAGLAGAIEVAGRAGYVTLDMSPGFGYTGIVIAMLAGLHPLGVLAASQGTMNNLLFGDKSFGYYETICGGSGVRADGASPAALGVLVVALCRLHVQQRLQRDRKSVV